MRVILASTSPRRRELLGLLKIPFEVVAPAFEEGNHAGEKPAQLACTLASGKALSCVDRYPDSLVLGSDTLIALDSETLGKPEDEADAAKMLRRLRGRRHLIHSAVALWRNRDDPMSVAVESVQVWMRGFTDHELTEYLHTGEWRGRAGAYSIQGVGGQLIERIEGDYTAAVGLPLRLVASLLATQGVVLPIEIESLYRAMPYPNWSRFAATP
ncbi:MAG: Maf family protein [Nitrospiraceae bacterium]